MADATTTVSFVGGLDMVSPVQEQSPGTLIDCLNYEVAPIKGYRRIDGYERFDDSVGGGISTLYFVDFRIDSTSPQAILSPGTRISRQNEVFGVITHVDGTSCYYVPTLPSRRPSPGDDYEAWLPTNQSYPASVLSSPVDSREVSPSYEDYVGRLREASALMRDKVVRAPRPIAGVFYGKDRAYAVVDCITIGATSPGGLAALSTGQYVRLEGIAYRVIRKTQFTADLAQISHVEDAPNGLQLITYNDIIGGGSYGSIDPSDWSYRGPSSETAQPYVVDGGYVPCLPGLAVYFDGATKEPTGSVVLSDGANTETREVVSYQVDEGGFSNGDAAGVVHLGPVVASSNFNGVFSGSVEMLDSDGVTKIADVDSRLHPFWAGTALLRTHVDNTFYQWGTYNFYATAGRDMVYAASGKTRAGWIAEDTFGLVSYGNIVTNFSFDLDKPKYLAFHAGQRLMLAFASGSVQLSAVGEPLNFSGFDGAVEIGNGDNITGLLEASDDSTLVFGPRTIRRIIGRGEGLDLRTIRSDAGAFNYTCSIANGVPVYVNQNGLCTLDQTSAYGDFKSSGISGAIDTWLTPRIIQDAYTAEIGGTVCAFPVRAKNQYRLFLGDGSVVNMSLTQEGAQAMLGSYSPPTRDLRIPLAYSSSVNDQGEEYILCVWDWITAAQSSLPSDNPPNSAMIYRLDHGWGFDGLTFNHFIDTAYVFNEEPNFITVSKAILYGLGYGSAKLRLRASGVEDDFYQEFNTTVQDISMPRNSRVLHKTLTRVMGEVDQANWGRAVKLRIQNVIAEGEEQTDPAHILQSLKLFVQTEGITE